MEQKYPIRVVSSKTGLSTHLIRMWERRYGAVAPGRTDTKRRLYCDEDVVRLSLLRRATQAGANIGQIARLSTDELNEIVSSYEQLGYGGRSRKVSTADPDHFLAAGLEAVRALDAKGIESVLLQASVSLGRLVLLERVVYPLLSRVGEDWSGGTIKVTHEHLASEVTRSFLGQLMDNATPDANAPLLISTTPAGQVHEFGALLAAVAAAGLGWRTMYLGPSLPADEIASAVSQSGAVAVALSVVYPPDDGRLPVELKSLRRLLGPEKPIIIGGGALPAYRKAANDIDAITVVGLSALASVLAELRNTPVAPEVEQ